MEKNKEIQKIREEISRLSAQLDKLENEKKDDFIESSSDLIDLKKEYDSEKIENNGIGHIENIKNDQIFNGTPLKKKNEHNSFNLESTVLKGTPLNVKKSEKKLTYNTEDIIGKNVMGVVASILIFIGLSSFIFLTLGDLSDIMKSVILNIVSLCFVFVGFRMMRKPNALSYSVLSCGIGSVFISLLLSGLYFNVVNELVLFLLLLIWCGISWKLTECYNSSIFFSIVSIGYYTSLILGMFSSYSTSGLVLFILGMLHLIYSLYVFKNKKYSNVMKQLLLMGSIIFEIVLIGQGNNIIKSILDLPFYPLYCLMVISIIQLIGYRFVNMSEIMTGKIVDKFYYVIMSVIGSLLCLGVINTIIQGMGSLIVEWSYPAYRGYYYTELINIIVCIVFIGLVLYNNVLKGNVVEKISITLLSLFSIVNMYNISTQSQFLEIANIIFVNLVLYVLIGFLFYIGNRFKSKWYIYLGYIYLLPCSVLNWLEVGLSFLWGREMTLLEILSGILFIVSCIGIMYYSWLKSYGVAKGLRSLNYISSLLLVYIISERLDRVLSRLFDYVGLREIIDVHALIGLCIFILFGLFFMGYNYLVSKEQSNNIWSIDIIRSDVLFKINSVFIFMLCMVGMGHIGVENLIYSVIYFILSVIMGFIDIKSIMRVNNLWSILYLIKYTCLIEAFLYSSLAAVREDFIFSIAGIIIAILFILIGFKFRHSYFRLYGLILSLLSVLKLTVLDITYQNSIEMVVGYILSGLLCFVIVFIYNKSIRLI